MDKELELARSQFLITGGIALHMLSLIKEFIDRNNNYTSDDSYVLTHHSSNDHFNITCNKDDKPYIIVDNKSVKIHYKNDHIKATLEISIQDPDLDSKFIDFVQVVSIPTGVHTALGIKKALPKALQNSVTFQGPTYTAGSLERLIDILYAD